MFVGVFLEGPVEDFSDSVGATSGLGLKGLGLCHGFRGLAKNPDSSLKRSGGLQTPGGSSEIVSEGNVGIRIAL